MVTNERSEQQVKRAVFVLNNFDQQNYPFEEMKSAIALGKKVDLVYTVPYFPPVIGAVAEFFRVFTNIQSEAKMNLNLVNEVLGLPASSLYILTPGATRFFLKRVERFNNGGIFASLRKKIKVASRMLSKISLMCFA